MNRRAAIVAAALLAGAPAAPGLATGDCAEDAMLVFDGSGSMSEAGFNEISEPRNFAAREAVRQAIPAVAAARDLGLIIYGPGGDQGPGACANLDLRFRPMPNAAPRVIDDVERLVPDGETPLTEAVALAASVLDFERKPGVIVLLTDGKETCEGAPCELAAELAADGYGLTAHVIGFKVRAPFFSWESQLGGGSAGAQTVARCLADRMGGKYYSPENAGDLANALDDALGCPIIGGPAFRSPFG